MSELICNQTKIPRTELRCGLRSSAAIGCGWVSTYNALAILGYETEPEDLIRVYQRQLPLVHGVAGTSFWGPALCLHRWGFPVKMIRRRELFDDEARKAPVCILFYRWAKKGKIGAHFVALRHTERGFVGYNTYKNSDGPDFYGESLDAFLRRKKYFGAILIPVRDLKK